ncbi:hypothetical protein WDW86_03105 [Bdellovibrionota bacterium FG-2]
MIQAIGFAWIVTAVMASASASAADSFGFSGNHDMRMQGRLKPQDYLYAPNPERRNDLFETLKPVDLGVNLAIGSDCGKINIDGTLRAAFGKVLNGDYFKGMAQDILGSAPMLAACYMSPTWCAILKHTQVSANFLAGLRLNQCQIVDKYVDSRVEDYYRERQPCVHRSIEANGGDMESAMGSCQNGVFEKKAGAWSGPSDDPNRPNNLLADSTRWAGFSGNEGNRITGLLQSIVGDTVLSNGNIRVDYGPRSHAYSPRSYLISMEQQIAQAFCGKLLPEFATNPQYITDAEIVRRMKALPSAPGEDETPMLTPDVVRNLVYLPKMRRDRICLKLSQAMAMQAFTRDMNRSIDVLTVASQNPNLPPNRKLEIDQKRQGLKDQVDLTLRLRQEQAKPVGEIMQYITAEGLNAQDEATRSNLSVQSGTESKASHAVRMNDCGDGVFCGK